MTVRGGKNRILIYIGAVFVTAAIVLLYHNSSQKLYDTERLYERCHMNEESLSAQLQVVFEYKVRLEKSLQQERKDHRQTKDEYQTKLEEERQSRERENTESITKFTALQQQYKLLQSQHEDVNSEFNKVRQEQLENIDEKTHLETQIKSLQAEMNKLTSSKVNDMESLKTKYLKIEQDYDKLQLENEKLKKQMNPLESKSNSCEKLKIQMTREISHYKDRLAVCEGSDQARRNLLPQVEAREETINEPETNNKLVDDKTQMKIKSSTRATRIEKEFGVNYNLLVNTSTPLINPDALLSQENKTVQHRYDTLDSRANSNHVQLNPFKDNAHYPLPQTYHQNNNNNDDDSARVLPMPGLLMFDHIPGVHSYKEKLKEAAAGGVGVQNVGGEVGDEGEPLVKHNIQQQQQPVVDEAVRHRIHNNAMERQNDYHYQEEYDKENRKEEEDDDDVDHLDLQNANELDEHHGKDNGLLAVQEQHPIHHQDKLQVDNGRDSVMVNPK